MDNSASAVVATQKQQSTTAQKSKKKSKNKKQVGNCQTLSSSSATESKTSSGTEQNKTKLSTAVSENGISENLKENLHHNVKSTKTSNNVNGVLVDKPDESGHDGVHDGHGSINGHHKTNGDCAMPSKSRKMKNESKQTKQNNNNNNNNSNNNNNNNNKSEHCHKKTQNDIGAGGASIKADKKMPASKAVRNGLSSANANDASSEVNHQKTVSCKDAEVQAQAPAQVQLQVQSKSKLQLPLQKEAQSELGAISKTPKQSQIAKDTDEPTEVNQLQETAIATATEAAPATETVPAPASASTKEAKNVDANAAAIATTSSTANSPTLETLETLETPAMNSTAIHIEYKEYESELQMHDIMRLIQAELSEPYSIYTYRYFIYNWPKLCFLAAHGDEYVGAIVCKLDMHMNVRRGYIAMLAVRKEYRKLRIGTTLVQKAIEAMLADNADEVVLETEMRNLPALRLYENLGFVRDKRLFRYYLNGVDALRLKLWFR